MAPAAEGGQADPADQVDDSDGTDQESGDDAAGREEGKEAIAAAEARQAAARETADRAGREVARQAGAGFGGCDEVPQPDSVAQDGGGVGPASTPPTTAPAAPAPAPAAPTQPVSLPATDAPAAPSSAEAEFLALLNAERAKVGLPGLALDGGLQAAAAAQAGNIASAGSLFHQDLIPLLGPWRTAGENVGFGPDVSSINTALVNSPGHYANMVDPDFTHVGIGVVVDGRRAGLGGPGLRRLTAPRRPLGPSRPRALTSSDPYRRNRWVGSSRSRPTGRSRAGPHALASNPSATPPAYGQAGLGP